MRDQAFTGRDVAEAVAAGRALGVAPESLRYVVLDAGSAGGGGLGATPARVVVLLDAPGVATAQPSAPAPRPGIRAVLERLAEVAGIDMGVEVEASEETLTVRLAGPGRELLMEGEGEVLRALEHLLRKLLQEQGEERRLVVECEGYRDRRDAALRSSALALAEEVRSDGVPRSTRPLNAFERRVIHLALSGLFGIRTYGVGEGSERRVVIAPAESLQASPGGED